MSIFIRLVFTVLSLIIVLLYGWYYFYTHRTLKRLDFHYDPLPDKLDNAVVFISDPRSCFWCLKQADVLSKEAKDFITFRNYEFSRLSIQDGIALARTRKLNHFSGFPVTLFFDCEAQEVKRVYGVFGVNQLIKIINEIEAEEQKHE